MKLFYFFYVLILFLSCRNQSEDKVLEPIELQIDQVFKTGGSMGVGNKHVDMADHYLILKEYNEEDASRWSDFVQFADNYRDTVQTTLPLSSITICRPYKITTNLAGGEGRDEFNDHLLLTINYSHQTMHAKLADIEGLTIWQKGQPYSVNLLTNQRKKKLGGYFDSTGEYSEKWWDRYKDQIPVDREEDPIVKTSDHPTDNR
jgi:hypothetical protein